MLSTLCRLPGRLPHRKFEEEESIKDCVLIDSLTIVYAKYFLCRFNGSFATTTCARQGDEHISTMPSETNLETSC